jgi:hypothetical protein
VVTKNAEIIQNLNLVNFVFSKFIINPKYIKNTILKAKKLYLKDSFVFTQVNNITNLAEYSLIEYKG